MKIGRLRDKGVERFIRFLDGHRAGIPQDLPKDVIGKQLAMTLLPVKDCRPIYSLETYKRIVFPS